jgi:hypothetical protein
MRGANRPLTSPSQALLTPWLASTTAHFTTGLGGRGAGSGTGQLGGDHLMENGEIGLDPEDLGVELHFALGRAIGGE